MIPQKVLQPLAHGQRIEESQVRAGYGEPPPIRCAQSEGAKGVEEHVNPYTALRAACKRVDESPRHGAGVDEIHLEQHRLARIRNGLEHSPEDPVTVGEQLKPVPLPPGPTDHGHALGTRHERILYALRAAVILLLLCPAPVFANAVGAVNRARMAYCGLSRATHPTLTENRRLDEIARLFAGGVPLDQAELHARYRPARSVWIRITGAADDAAVERMVGQRFCGQISDPRLQNIGVYGRGESGLWIIVAQPFITPPERDAAAVSRVVLALTNQARAHARTCGWRRFAAAPPLSLAPALARAARAHSRDMVAHDFFSHTGSDGSTPGERVTRAGYRWSMVGENIASGSRTPQEVVAGWLASPHHCANIMTAGFRQMGVAFAVDRASTQVIDWTEDFGTPR